MLDQSENLVHMYVKTDKVLHWTIHETLCFCSDIEVNSCQHLNSLTNGTAPVKRPRSLNPQEPISRFRFQYGKLPINAYLRLLYVEMNIISMGPSSTKIDVILKGISFVIVLAITFS